MKFHASLSYAPYRPPFFRSPELYINRVVPSETGIHLEWLAGNDNAYKDACVFYRVRGTDAWQSAQTVVHEPDSGSAAADITGLCADTDYEFYVETAGKTSCVRLARTGKAGFGTVVNYLHPDDLAYSFSGRYLCSPSLVRLPDGALAASMDLFAGGYPQNLTLVYRSEDDGKSWHYACELFPCFWGKLFVYEEKLYMLACTTEYGDLIIAESEDGGRSFGAPVTLLRGGGGKNGEPGVHKNPQPLVEYAGRLWGTLEWGSWGRNYHAAMVMSAPLGSNLLCPESWTFSEPVKYDKTWPGVPEGESSGMIEGSLTVAPDGGLYNIMRYDMSRLTPGYGLALVFRVDEKHPDAPLTFARTMAFDANHAKFTIRYDEPSGCYITLADRITGPESAHSRNLLSLMYSRDLVVWKTALDVIDRRECDPAKVGFQYVDFFVEGEDIRYLCRTAVCGAANFHDSNYSVYAEIKNFRRYLV